MLTPRVTLVAMVLYRTRGAARVGHLLERLEAAVASESDQRIFFFYYRVCEWVEDHCSVRAPDRDDYDSVFGPNASVFQRSADER